VILYAIFLTKYRKSSIKHEKSLVLRNISGIDSDIKV